MAFHQPARQAAPRNPRPTTLGDGESCVPQLAATRPVDESPTWVLFSPATDTGTTVSHLTSTPGSNITPGRSRLSDLGSLNTLAPSEISPGQQASNGFIDAAEEEDDAELDSLDSHLPEFRSAPDTFISSDHVPHSTPVLPAHDGLGSFRLEQEGMGLDVQNRLYAFERYNPRRIKRRRESLEAVRAELEGEENQQIDKMLRIESWRLEQSRYLLEEIQKETRRRRSSTNSMSRTHRANQQAAEDAATLETIDMDTSEEWHDQNHDPSDDRDSIWGRIARKVMQDIMGIESGILSILFGEGLPNEEQLSSTINASGLSSSRRDDSHFPHVLPDSSWEVKMMGRVAKELGLLVHQLSDHPGGFSTFSRIQQMSIPYAGLPAIPESASALISDAVADEKPPSLPEFRPTIPTLLRPTDGTETQHQPSSGHSNPQQQTDNGVTFTQEEWEQDLDIRLVFRYLRSRFLPFSKGSGGLSSTPHIATSTTSTQDAAAKAARVRQHHPLVSRSRNTERRKSKSTTVSNSGLFKPVSSCASQSTRRSVKRSSTSSRHYWDIGGSVGTGSIIATVGPMGSWGEI
ncbi:hypothetical protein GGR50DRAFT_426438 [Xylaria sp. CBS 124048]|nr:hypothetical protein GGR50DRAFT_426438 [Xylaria sp. CBS 124048]